MKKIIVLLAGIFICSELSAQALLQKKSDSYLKNDSDSKNSEITENILSYKIENTADNLYIMTLENGLTVFVREDFSSALIHCRFSCKAGFSKQTKFDAGFFPLYTKLFSSTSLKQNDILKKISLDSECNADSATYTADFSPLFLDDFLNSLNICVSNPKFTDEEINKTFFQMKKEIKEYENSIAGFINSAIDSRIFYKAPWKVDSGIYPALFSSYSPQEARTILNDIGKKYYVPENCALFISGNISKEKVYELCKKNFSKWQNSQLQESPFFNEEFYSDIHSASYDNNSYSEEKKLQKKYVLISPDFSPEITQLVIQYKSLSLSQADILSSAWNNFDSPLKHRILNNPVIAVRSGDYISCSSAQKSGSSRLIIQSLMEEPYSFSEGHDDFIDENGNLISTEKPSVASQAENFVEEIKSSALLNRKQFISAQNEIYSRYKSQNGSSVENMNMLSDFWALNQISSHNQFYQNYLQFAHNIQMQSEKSIAEKILTEEPYIFLLVNSAVYNSQKDSFTESGYEVITKKTAGWYSTEINLIAEKKNLIKKSSEENSKNQENNQNINFAESFYVNNRESIKSFNLKNGIPVIIKENPDTQNACISISIYGGELASPDNERYLRTVLINAFARNIQNELTLLKRTNTFEGKTSLKAWTEEAFSYITITVSKQDIPYALQAAFNAVIYGEVSPVTADNLVSEQSFQWRTKNAFLTQQLKCNAFSYLYRDSSFAKLFDNETPVLKKTTYNSISLAYTQLLDAALYSIVIAGDITETDAKKYFENNFEILLKQKDLKKINVPEPKFKNKNRNVQLSHTFTSDMPVELAPKESPLLIPTKEFFDPAQFYFIVPEENFHKEIFNALLYEFEYLIQQNLGEANRVTSYPATFYIHAGIIQAEQLRNASVFLRSYKTARDYIFTELTKAFEEEQQLIEKINSSKKNEELLNSTELISDEKNSEKTISGKSESEKNKIQNIEVINSFESENISKSLKNNETEEITKSNENSPDEANLKTQKLLEENINDFEKTSIYFEAENVSTDEINLNKIDLPELTDCQLLLEIKALWTLKNLSGTKDNEGTAALIHKGLIQETPELYLKNYVEISNATTKDFLAILEKYFTEEPPFKVYSVDSKK